MPTVAEIAQSIGATLLGDGALTVAGLAEPGQARETDLALAMSPRYADALSQGAAKAAVVWDGADWQALGLKAAIVIARPRLAMSQLTQMMDHDPVRNGIHPTAVIDPRAVIGADVAIGPFCVIGAGAQIGDRTILESHVTVADGSVIGKDGLVATGVRVRRNVQIGARAILQPNCVIGGDGFSFVTATPSIAEIGRRTLGRTPLEPIADATQHRIHSLGGVVLGDDVEVGANSTIDAGTIRPTTVGSGTKIDNLVHVGHNCQIGRDCLLCGRVGVAGSVTVGDRTILGGGAAVGDNLKVGSDCVFGGATGALMDVPDGSFMMGYPAKPIITFRAEQRAMRNVAKKK